MLNYYSALKYYYDEGYTYFELGDGDELWKNKKFSEISSIYTDIFHLLHTFYTENRLYMLYGNHDIVKRYPDFVKKNLESYFHSHLNSFEPLFENLKAYEGLILKNTDTQTKLLLIHGHQGDILNDIFWKIGRFLSRYFWRRMEFFGYKDPTSAAKNYNKKRKVERKILEWVVANNQPVIAGHTHRPSCPPEGEHPYFNTGSCIHPNCITCIEIEDSVITLVKWSAKTKDDRTVYFDRHPIALPRKI
jgi:UDP-2,3-diacylglucosamine pyrophosphatase LpxH